MIFYHVGLTLLIVWFVMRGVPTIDYRPAMLGAILPDLIDKPLGRIFFSSSLDSGRLVGHTLLFNALLLGAILFLQGKKKKRLALFGIASLLHLALDGMWDAPRVFFWPAFGFEFPADPLTGGWLSYFRPSVFALEALGIGVLVFLLSAHGSLNREGIKRLATTGALGL